MIMAIRAIAPRSVRATSPTPTANNMSPRIGRRLGLPVEDERSLWKDRALVELNRAVLWSFDDAGIKIADHHRESKRFMSFVAAEEKAHRARSGPGAAPDGPEFWELYNGHDAHS